MQTMNRHAKLPSMHIDNCLVNLGELCMILTVHGSDHKNQNAQKSLMTTRGAGRQADRLNHKCD